MGTAATTSGRDDSHREALLVTADVAVKPLVHCDVLRRSEVAPDVAKLLARAGMSWGCVSAEGASDGVEGEPRGNQ